MVDVLKSSDSDSLEGEGGTASPLAHTNHGNLVKGPKFYIVIC